MKRKKNQFLYLISIKIIYLLLQKEKKVVSITSLIYQQNVNLGKKFLNHNIIHVLPSSFANEKKVQS